MQTLIVRCPNCGKDQKTQPRLEHLSDMKKKVKRCVYCGKSFKIHSCLPKSHIVSISKK